MDARRRQWRDDPALAWFLKGEPMTRDTIERHAVPSAVEPDAHGQAALLLTESLLHMLVENGELTNAQAVDVVHTLDPSSANCYRP